MTTSTERKRQQRAWVLYDVANSAFATTMVAAVFPVYFASVAASTLEPATATQYFSITTSIALAIVAIASPFLGAYSDLAGNRIRLLTGFMAAGALATAAMALVDNGDWLLAAGLFIVGRIGFGGANVFYDALLPHVADTTERDRVSSRGFAFGYLGGGTLLAANVALIFALDGSTWGPRLSFLSVGIWWAAFSLPLIRNVSEPPRFVLPGDTEPAKVTLHETVVATWHTLRDLGSFTDLRRFLLAFLVYNDGINAVVAMAAIFGTELGFEPTQLILAILLVQFTGMPYTLLWGRVATNTRYADRLLVYLILNIATVPALGIGWAHLGPQLPSGLTSALMIVGVLAALQILLAGVALVLPASLGRALLSRLTTAGTVTLTLIAYLIVAVWGFFLTQEVEFWALAWLVSVAQGGAQALSRSIYASLVPPKRSGEFFGLFSILSKAASVVTPLLFAASVWLFASSRPAMLALAAIFLLGIALLQRVDLDRGRALAATSDVGPAA